MPEIKELGIRFDATMADGDIGKKSGRNLSKVTAISEMLIVPKYAINYFTNDAGIREVGSTLNSWTFAWQYNQTDANPAAGTQQITPIASGSWTNPIAVATRAIAVTGAGLTPAVPTTYTYTLAATGTDGNVVTANSLIRFQLKRYFGVSALNLTTDVQIRTLLSNEFATARAASKSIDCSAGTPPNWIYYCYPASYGRIPGDNIVTFGLPTTWTYSLITGFVNASGHAEDYILYKSPNTYGVTVPIIVP